MSSKIWDSPLSIGSIIIKNRVVFPPLSGNWADPNGFVTDRIINFYKDRAEGGCGMIVVSGTAVTPEGKGTDRSLCLYNEKQLYGFKILAETIKANDCFASIQLMHVGGQGNPDFTGCNPLSPSGLKCNATGFVSRELAVEEIKEIREKFVNSAVLAFRAGFQAVELHLAHGYLLHEFLSEHANKRKDEYGGSITNRTRLVIEIIASIRKKVPDLVIGIRISGEDYVKDGINEEVNQKLLPLLEDAEVGYFSVTAGVYETSKLKHEAMKRGEFFKYSKGIKAIVNKPVIGVGKILDLETAEKHLQNGDCDMVAIGRGMVADPFMIKKVRNNQPFTRCLECGQCQYLRLGKKDLQCPLGDQQSA